MFWFSARRDAKYSSIHDAVRNGDVRELEAMVKNGASVNEVDNTKDKFTPVHWACHRGALEVRQNIWCSIVTYCGHQSNWLGIQIVGETLSSQVLSILWSLGIATVSILSTASTGVPHKSEREGQWHATIYYNISEEELEREILRNVNEVISAESNYKLSVQRKHTCSRLRITNWPTLLIEEKNLINGSSHSKKKFQFPVLQSVTLETRYNPEWYLQRLHVQYSFKFSKLIWRIYLKVIFTVFTLVAMAWSWYYSDDT